MTRLENVGAHDVDHADARIAHLATRQDGVVGRDQLVALGLTRRAIEHRLRTGHLIVLHRGVYAVGHAALTDRSHARAALLAAGHGAVLSHRTAAALWRLIPSTPPFVEVVTTARARRSRPGLIIHETRRPPDVRTVHSLPVTAPLRTLVDLAATQPKDLADRAAGEALVLRLVTEPELEEAGLLTPEVAPTRSELERAMLRLAAGAGLPPPAVNHPLGPYVIDFLWRDHRVAVETDGYGTHGRRTAFERDRSRDADLSARGYVVLRFTWRQLRDDPLLVAARLAQVLARRC